MTAGGIGDRVSFRRVAMGAVACCLLGACASPPARQAPLSAASTTDAASTAAVLNGKMNVDIASVDDTPNRNMTAGFALEGSADDGRLDLTAPTGSILARAEWSPGSVVLHADGKDRLYATLGALTADVLGEPLPVDALFDWLQGRPWPAAPSTVEVPPAGPGFVQLGWRVDLSRFAAGNVVARRLGPPAVTVRVKLDTP